MMFELVGHVLKHFQNGSQDAQDADEPSNDRAGLMARRRTENRGARAHRANTRCPSAHGKPNTEHRQTRTHASESGPGLLKNMFMHRYHAAPQQRSSARALLISISILGQNYTQTLTRQLPQSRARAHSCRELLPSDVTQAWGTEGRPQKSCATLRCDP